MHPACCTRWAARRWTHALHGQGHLVYEYNMMIIERYIASSDSKLLVGSGASRSRPVREPQALSRGGVLKVDGQNWRTTVKRTVPAAFSASESFDIASISFAVLLDYFDRRRSSSTEQSAPSSAAQIRSFVMTMKKRRSMRSIQ